MRTGVHLGMAPHPPPSPKARAGFKASPLPSRTLPGSGPLTPGAGAGSESPRELQTPTSLRASTATPVAYASAGPVASGLDWRKWSSLRSPS